MKALLRLAWTTALAAGLWGNAAGQVRENRPTAETPSGGGVSLSEETPPSPWRAAFSGHARTMQESYEGQDFGLGELEDDAWLHQRVQVLLTLDHEENLRFVTELTWGRMWGKALPLAPPDQDEVDFLQLHGQVRMPVGAADTLTVRAGRQTLYYGSGRLLASREGANQRLAHDAVLLSWSGEGSTRVDAFIASPVQIEESTFDNQSHPEEVRFWSLYAVLPSAAGPGHFLDLYYIGLHDEDSLFVADSGVETRHTVGSRWWSEGQPFSYNTELILQWGEAGDRAIFAGAASLGAGYEFTNLPGRPTLELRADAISGGGDEGELHTFHPLFQANNYFNEGGFVSPSNLYNLNPVLTLQPHSKVKTSLGVNFLWRFSAADDVYGPPLQRLAGPDPTGERYLGTAFNAAVTWTPSAKVEVFLGYTYHHAGRSLTQVGGGDETYFQASFRVEF